MEPALLVLLVRGHRRSLLRHLDSWLARPGAGDGQRLCMDRFVSRHDGHWRPLDFRAGLAAGLMAASRV